VKVLLGKRVLSWQ